MRYVLLLPLFLTAPVAAGAQQRASTPSHAPAADTVKIGRYDLEITTDDGTLVGDLTVKRDNGTLTAKVNAGGRVPNVKSFVRDGRSYVLTGGHDEFTVVYRFTFAGDSVSGAFEMSGGLKGTLIGAYKR